jgi:hypothetical protein
MFLYNILSDERMGLSFTIAAGPCQRSHSQARILRTHDHILLSQIWDYHCPNLEGQVPIFISPRNKVAQLYSKELGSIFVASYNSQGYGGGIWPCLHMGWDSSVVLQALYLSLCCGLMRKHCPQQFNFCMHTWTSGIGAWCYLVMDALATFPWFLLGIMSYYLIISFYINMFVNYKYLLHFEIMLIYQHWNFVSRTH